MSNDFIKLPGPESVKPKKKPKPIACSDCRTPLAISRGWGYCESCHRGTSLPIGRIVSKKSNGLEVHLLPMVLRELKQDGTIDETHEDLEDELREKGYLIMEEPEP